MNLLPLVGFYYRRHAQISALLSKGGAGNGGQKALDFVQAIAPVLKKWWPETNKDGLLDDIVATLESVVTDAPDPQSPYPDHTQR